MMNKKFKLDSITKEKILSSQIGDRRYEFTPPYEPCMLKDIAPVVLKIMEGKWTDKDKDMREILEKLVAKEDKYENEIR